MSVEERLRRLPTESEREARRLGWHRGCAITWREFLEQYPYGVGELAKHRRAMSDAA